MSYEMTFDAWFEREGFNHSVKAAMLIAWEAAKVGPCEDCEMQERGS